MLNKAGGLGMGVVSPERLQKRAIAGIKVEIYRKFLSDFNLPSPCRAADKLIMKNYN